MHKVLWLAGCLCALALIAPVTAGAQGSAIPGQYVVVLKSGSDSRAVAREHGRNAGADVITTYGAALDGYAARLTPAGLARVKADPRVADVVQDVEGTPADAQMLPTGVNRIDAELAPTGSPSTLTATTTRQVSGDVAVFDSGIDTRHPDLNVAGGVDCLKGYSGDDGTYNDSFGHGTHVAGIIGAKDDSNGVVGVAPGVRLWSVRVLNGIGSGSTSTQLCGIDWITANGPALGIRVANSSQALFGSPDDGNCGNTAGDVLHQAICRSTAAGITWVFAAANTAGDFKGVAGASYDEVLTATASADSNGTPNVGSTATFACDTVLYNQKKKTYETDDKYGTFSKYATLASDLYHTVAAPGACIYSTFKGGTYGKLTGTSMAAPHVAGTVELCIVSGQCTGTPAEIIQKIRSDAAGYNLANPKYGFGGDPLRPVTGRYYGYLVQADLY